MSPHGPKRSPKLSKNRPKIDDLGVQKSMRVFNAFQHNVSSIFHRFCDDFGDANQTKCDVNFDHVFDAFLINFDV